MATGAVPTSTTTEQSQQAPQSSYLQGSTQDGVDKITAGDPHATGHRKAHDGADTVQPGSRHPNRGDHCRSTDSVSVSWQ